jgi:hypothetical protein
MPTAKIPFRVVGTFVPFVFVLWKDIRAIKYEHEFGVISVKQFFTDEEYQKVDRSKKAGTIASTDPPMLHSKPLPISKKKCDDLMTFLDFIDPTFHSFYKNLSSDDWGIYFSDYEKLEDEDRFLKFLNIYFGFV